MPRAGDFLRAVKEATFGWFAAWQAENNDQTSGPREVQTEIALALQSNFIPPIL